MTEAESPFHSGFVAVVGRPNVGKSTLVNRMVGQKIAIVSDKPQTTRRRILGIVHRREAQLVLVDTPGIHKPQHRMNAAMVRDAEDALAGADLVLFLVDVAEKRGAGELYVLDRIRASGRPVLLALNKIDRVRRQGLLALIEDFSSRFEFREIVPLSARTGDGVELLMTLLIRHLPQGPPLFPREALTTVEDSVLMTEIIREKLLDLTREELPYSTAVVADAIRRDQAKGLTVVSASIVVEREGQKAIVIGRGGSLIRQVGEAARKELEERYGGKFFLELFVRVRERWREDEAFLAEIVNKDL